MCRPAEGGARLVPIDTPDHLQRRQQLFGVDYRPLLRCCTRRGAGGERGGRGWPPVGRPAELESGLAPPFRWDGSEGRVLSRKGRGLKGGWGGWCRLEEVDLR